MTEEHTYRVLVRGRFTDLDDPARARLRAAAHQHDMLTTGFSEEGGLTYDQALDFFSYRVQLTATVETTDRTVCNRALTMAAQAIEKLNVDFRDLKAKATDINQIKIPHRK
jgi:hypothetical protein